MTGSARWRTALTLAFVVLPVFATGVRADPVLCPCDHQAPTPAASDCASSGKAAERRGAPVRATARSHEEPSHTGRTGPGKDCPHCAHDGAADSHSRPGGVCECAPPPLPFHFARAADLVLTDSLAAPDWVQLGLEPLSVIVGVVPAAPERPPPLRFHLLFETILV